MVAGAGREHLDVAEAGLNDLPRPGPECVCEEVRPGALPSHALPSRVRVCRGTGTAGKGSAAGHVRQGSRGCGPGGGV